MRKQKTVRLLIAIFAMAVTVIAGLSTAGPSLVETSAEKQPAIQPDDLVNGTIASTMIVSTAASAVDHPARSDTAITSFDRTLLSKETAVSGHNIRVLSRQKGAERDIGWTVNEIITKKNSGVAGLTKKTG